MNLLAHRPRTAEAAVIRDRIFNVLPAASYQMEKLFGLLDIEFSERTETACVECRTTPRLLLNRPFVEEHCREDGDLFLLILHELHHIILGHTRLFPRVTPLDNLVFDAVINSMLARTVGRTVGVGLFTRLYSYDKFPERLLRPPPGWPGSFKDALNGLSEREARAVQLLYGPEAGAITYYDIYELLRQSLCDGESEGGLPDVVLLGSHGEDAGENPLLTEVVRRIVEGWPPPPFRISGRDEGKEGADYFLSKTEQPGAAFQRAFAQVLRRCGVNCGRGPAVYRRRLSARERTIETVIPDARDRRVTALRAFFGHSPLVYRSSLNEIRPRPLRVPVVHLYLDVSGSMSDCLPYLTAVCREPFHRGELAIFAFSTVVSDLKGADLAKVAIRNTGGTDINAVLGHLGRIPRSKRPRVILIATDGYVGPVRDDLRSTLGHTRVVAALTHPGHADDLKPWVHQIFQLPSP
jgi:hypothetical protein